jgi:hypothetical protein
MDERCGSGGDKTRVDLASRRVARVLVDHGGVPTASRERANETPAGSIDRKACRTSGDPSAGTEGTRSGVHVISMSNVPLNPV